jgi:hypothetical protein
MLIVNLSDKQSLNHTLHVTNTTVFNLLDMLNCCNGLKQVIVCVRGIWTWQINMSVTTQYNNKHITTAIPTLPSTRPLGLVGVENAIKLKQRTDVTQLIVALAMI